MERQIPKPGERYTDANEHPYQILCVASNDETKEKMVVYQALYGEFECFVRPLGEPVGKKQASDEPLKTSFAAKPEENSEEQADPVLLQFLDADTLEQKYQIIKSLRATITNRLIDDFAVTLDLVIPEGDVDIRYQQLLSGVRTLQKFETTRFRKR